MKNKKALPLLLIAVSAALAVASFLLLPDTVVMQFSLGGSGATTAPKLLAVLLPTALGIGGAAVALTSGNGDGDSRKPLLVLAVGIVVFALMLIVNLAR